MVVFVAVAGWAFASCSSEPSQSAPPVREAPAAPAVAAVDPGQALFEANCAACHGAQGLGDGPMAASLPTQPANIREHFGDHSFDEMARRVTEGIPPTMPPAPIPPEEVRQALSYVWSLIPDSAQARLRALQELAAEEH
jgi:high-affinity iron transporter